MKLAYYSFEERLARASTLPSDWYTNPEMLELEKRRVFGRSWQLVGRVEQVERPGDFFTASIADEPIIVARAADEKLRAFSNVCRHRAGPVTAGSGNRRAFQCGYHGWSYSLEGRLLGTPEFDEVECFNKETICLPEFKVETAGALVFANLDPSSAPLAETLEDLASLIGRGDLSTMKLAARKDWYVDCNWKVYVDNYLEGYHIPIVHPSLNREIDYARYRTETLNYYSIQHSPIRESAKRLQKGEHPDNNNVQFSWLFPNLMLNVYTDNYSTNLIVPLGPERTLTIFEWYFRDLDNSDVQEAVKRSIEFSDEIQREDIAICEAVQRGLRSRTYTSGRYSVKRENGVHHFHGLLTEFLGRE
ncbi:MAG TPA: SRPBCC family protein [Blastocatellia bacterium]|nr:SRPBCC family protein [Blastocatellia bacterium]